MIWLKIKPHLINGFLRAVDLLEMESLDPHFDDGSGLSPIARFEPSEIGKALAMKLAKTEF